MENHRGAPCRPASQAQRGTASTTRKVAGTVARNGGTKRVLPVRGSGECVVAVGPPASALSAARRMHLPMLVDRPRGRHLTSSFPRALPRKSHSDRGPRGGNGHTPFTTTNTPFWPAAARSHVVRDPPRIETCASAPRLGRDLGLRMPYEALDQPRRTSRRGLDLRAPSSGRSSRPRRVRDSGHGAKGRPHAQDRLRATRSAPRTTTTITSGMRPRPYSLHCGGCRRESSSSMTR